MAISSWMLRSASSSKRRKGSEISRKLPMAKPWCSTKISAISWISVNWFWILSGLVIGTKSRNSAWACSVCRYSVNWSLTLLNSNWSKIFVFIASIIAHLPMGRGGGKCLRSFYERTLVIRCWLVIFTKESPLKIRDFQLKPMLSSML